MSTARRPPRRHPAEAQLRLRGRALDRPARPAPPSRSTDPATGETIGHVAALTAAQARAATDAAEAAFPAWSGLLPQERSAVLRRWHALIVAGPRGSRPA